MAIPITMSLNTIDHPLTTIQGPLTMTPPPTTVTPPPTSNDEDEEEEYTSCHNKRALQDNDNNQPNKKRRRRHSTKRVHFAVFDDDETIPPHEEVHIVPRVEDIDAPLVWYSAEEFHHARRCDAHWISFYSYYEPSEAYKQQLFRVLGTACGKLPNSHHANAVLANSSIRGLERDMTPCFRQRKRHVMANVLQSQSALSAWNTKHDDSPKDADKGAELLAAHYHKLARPATRFARLLAEGDAQVVAAMNKAEEQEL